MLPGKLSKNDFSEALEKLVSHENASPPQALLPLIRRFWDSPDLALTTSTLGTADTTQLPPGFVEAVSGYRDDGPEFLLQSYPDFAMAVVLTKIWLTKLRDSQMQRRLLRDPKSRELRRWVEILLPVARYLEPVFDPNTKVKEYPEILDCLKDVHWVQPWVGKADLAQSIACYISNKGYIPRNTYQGWRAAGVKRLYLAVQAVIGDTPMTATNIVETLSSMGSIEESEADDSLPLTMTEAARVSTTTPATKTSPLINLPPLPRLRIERQQQPDIITALLDGQHRAFILYGGAGMGKTTLAGQVLRAPEVQAAFPGGIAWAAGNSSVEEIAAAWCAALNLKRSPNTTWTLCWRQGSANIEKTLLVLDDVAASPDLMVLFDFIGPNAVVLFTTQFGQETWETLARNWLEPELIWRLQIGPFSPAETRALLEQEQQRQLTDEEWAVVEQLGVQGDWDPEYLGQVALQSDLAEWQVMLAELRTAPDALHNSTQRVRAQWERLEHDPLRAHTEKLAATMLEPRPFGTLYAAAVWKVAPETAARRLQEQARLGLIQPLEFHDPVGLIPRLWHIPKRVQSCITTTSPSSFNPDPDRQRRRVVARQRAELARIILRDAGPAWRAPWQFQLLGIPWILTAVLWEPWGGIWHLLGTTLGTRAPQNWRSIWQRWWLAGAENARVAAFKRRGAHVPMEYQCLTDASYDIRNIILIGAGTILVGFMALALYGLSLTAASRAALFNSVGFRYTWLALLIGLSLWGFTQITHTLWLLYRMGVDYPPLHWLARAAQWLGMREPLRMQHE